MGQFVHNFLEQELFSRAFSFILLINCNLHENATKKKKKITACRPRKQHGSLPSIQGFNRGKGREGKGKQQGKYWKILKTPTSCQTPLWVAKLYYPHGGGIPSHEINTKPGPKPLKCQWLQQK